MNSRYIDSSSPRRPSLSTWRLFLALGLTLLALGTAARATDYYVDQQAAGGGDGTINSKWNSVAQVNAHGAFAAGDNIWFNRGDTFTGTKLVVNRVAAGTTPVTYGATPGTGANPIISMTGDHCITMTGNDYVTIQDLDLRNGTKGLSCTNIHNIVVRRVNTLNTGGSGILLAQGGNITVDDCNVSGFGNGGIYCIGGFVEPLHDVTISNCVVHDANPTSKADGIIIHEAAPYDGTTPTGANFILKNNISSNCKEQGFDITTGSNILLEGNSTFNNAQGGITIAHSAHNVTIRYHNSQNEPTSDTAGTIMIAVPNVTVEYSTFNSPVTVEDNHTHTGQIPNLQPMVLVQPAPGKNQPENLVLRNNLFVWNSTASGDIFRTANNGDVLTAENLTMKNNIFYSGNGSAPRMNFRIASRPPNYVNYRIQNNLYDNAPATVWLVGGATVGNYAAYKAAYDSTNAWNEKSNDPGFVNAAARDYRLLSGSVARDAGTSAIRTDTTPDEPAMLTLDFTRPTAVTIPQNSVRDIGAYEFPVSGGSVPDAPGGLIGTPVSSSEIDLSWNAVTPTPLGYRMYRGATAETITTNVSNDLGATTINFNDINLDPATTYHYAVRAFNSIGESVNSTPISATTDPTNGTPIIYEAESATLAPVSNLGAGAISTFTEGGASGGSNSLLTSNAVGDFITYTINVSTAGTYNITVAGTKYSSRATCELYVNNSSTRLGGLIDLYYAGPGYAYTPLFNQGDVALNAGNNTLKFRVFGAGAGGGWKLSFDYIQLTPQGVPNSVPSITTTTLAGGTQNVAYSQTLAATGGDGALVWSLDTGALPAGLSLSTAGVISGTPSASGTANFTVRVADSDGVTGAGDEDTQALSLTVIANTAPSITTTTLAGGTQNVAYSQTLAATGGDGALVWSLDAGALPAGLSLSSAGVISGTPSASGTANFTVRVADSDGVTGAGDEDTQALSLVINAATATVTVSASDPNASEAGLNTGTFTFTRSSSVGALTVNYTLTGSTATSGGDYTSIGASVGFIDGQTTTTKVVTPIQDTTVEGNETVVLTLAAGTGYTIGAPNAATVTIADNDYLFEAENPALIPTGSSGDVISTFVDGTHTNSLLTSNAVGDFITYTINVPVAGTYNITVAGTKYSSRATCELYVNNSTTRLGGLIDLYYAGPGYAYTPLFNQGNVALNAGNNTLKFRVFGAGAGGGWKLSFDYINVTQ